MNTQISKITTLFLNYPKMLCVWNATEFVFLSDDCVGFKVSTPIYKGTVIITWQDNAFYFMNLNALSRHFFFCSRFGCTYRFSVVPMFE